MSPPTNVDQQQLPPIRRDGVYASINYRPIEGEDKTCTICNSPNPPNVSSSSPNPPAYSCWKCEEFFHETCIAAWPKNWVSGNCAVCNEVLHRFFSRDDIPHEHRFARVKRVQEKAVVQNARAEVLASMGMDQTARNIVEDAKKRGNWLTRERLLRPKLRGEMKVMHAKGKEDKEGSE